jgi:hypothetical protein
MPYSNAPRLKRFVQAMRAVSYALMLGAGGAMLLVGNPPFGPWYLAMAVTCVLGGLMSLLGQVSDRWAGELMGLPLLGTAMSAFGLLTYRDTAERGLIAAPSIFLLVAFGVLLLMRWVDLWMLARSARVLARRNRRYGIGGLAT